MMAMQLCQNWSEPPMSWRRDDCCRTVGHLPSRRLRYGWPARRHIRQSTSVPARVTVYDKEERIPLNKTHFPTPLG
jgi:hypothetical protein